MSVYQKYFKALLVVLVAVIVGGILVSCGGQDISGSYKGKVNFEWIVEGEKRTAAADMLTEAERKDIGVELILNQSQKSISGTINLTQLSQKGVSNTFSIESGVIEGNKITFITEPPPYGGRLKFEGRINGRLLQGIILVMAPGQSRESGYIEGTLTATKQ